MEYNKQSLVEFISANCRIKGKKLPKTKLNTLPLESLIKLVESDEKLRAAYAEYARGTDFYVEGTDKSGKAAVTELRAADENAAREKALTFFGEISRTVPKAGHCLCSRCGSVTEGKGKVLCESCKAERLAEIEAARHIESPEKAEELKALVSALNSEPESFLNIMQLSRFLGNLPYGSISEADLADICASSTDAATQLTLLKYITNQAEYFNE